MSVISIKKTSISTIYFILSLCSIFVFSAAYSIVTNPIFPILLFVILVLSIFLFKGKYRFFVFLFATPFSVFFNIKQISIGSLFTYAISIYCFVVLIEQFISKAIKSVLCNKQTILLLFFSIYAILISFLFTGFFGALKTMAQCSYFAFLLFFIFDKKASKDIKATILLIGFGLLASNILASTIFYVFKGQIAIRFLQTFSTEVYVKAYTYPTLQFRYPGLFGDPNYTGFYIILATLLFLININRFKNKILPSAVFIILQFFAILGMSKNYLVVMVLVLFIFLVKLVLQFRNTIFFLMVFCLLSLFLVMILGSVFLPLIKRFIFLDLREGFLNAITTERSTLVSYYLSDYMRNPVMFLLGHGLWNSMLDGGSSSHNIFISIIWYFGIPGTVLYIAYFVSFFKIKTIAKSSILKLFLLVVTIYGLSLDFSTNSIIYFFFFAVFSYCQDKNVLISSEIINLNTYYLGGEMTCERKEIAI